MASAKASEVLLLTKVKITETEAKIIQEGKPFFVAVPYDDAQAIIATLTRTLGPDGFHYVTPLPEGTVFLEDHEDFESF